MTDESEKNSFRVHRVVEFADTDMAGIVHFATFFRYMEAAEHAYLRSCGLSVVSHWEGEKITFPRVNATCDYVRPARFEDELTLIVQVLRIGRTSITYQIDTQKHDGEVARGQITAVLCRIRDDHSLEPMPFPDLLRKQIKQGMQ